MTEAVVSPALAFEDLYVGRRFTSGIRSIETAEIKAFAASFDPQPFHLDELAASGSMFAGLAASGWHTAALTMRLLVESVPFEGGVVGVDVEVAWPRPTRPGDALRVESEIVELRASRSRPTQGWVKLKAVTLNQQNEEVQVLTANLVVPRRQ